MLVPGVDAVGVRFNPITRKIGKLQFTNVCPVVVITKQGITPVGNRQSDNGVGGLGQLQAGGPSHAAVAVLDAPPKLSGEPERSYPIGHVVFAIDVSSSMSEGCGSPYSTTKLKHIQQTIMTLAQSGIPDDTPLTLITFDTKSTTVIEHSTKVKSFFDAIGDLICSNNTNITSAFEEAIRKFQKHETDPSNPDRKFFMLVTDGDHNTPDNDPLPIHIRAEQLGLLNCGSFIIGVGTQYNRNLIQECASRLGYAGWCHTPEDKSGVNVFARNIPAFLAQMRSMDYYVNVVAEGFTGDESDRRFFSLTPAIIRAMYQRTGTSHLGIDFLTNPHYVAKLGYQREGYSIGFANPCDLDNENARLFLCLQNHSAGNLVFPKKQIPIYTPEDLPSYGMFEEKQEAERIRDLILRAPVDLEHFLCLDAGDPDAFDDFIKRNPDFVDPNQSVVISRNLRNKNRDDFNEQHSRTSVSNAGSVFTSQTIADWSPIQAGTVADVNKGQRKPNEPTSAGYDGHSGPLHSNLEEPKRPDDENKINNPPELHSGVLGPPEAPVQGPLLTIHDGQILDPHVYDDAIPINSQSIPKPDASNSIYLFSGNLTLQVIKGNINLVSQNSKSMDGLLIDVGRSPDSDLVLNLSAVSRHHCSIQHTKDGYFIGDNSSRNGTYVNGTKVNGRVNLTNGDTIKICGFVFLVHIKQP